MGAAANSRLAVPRDRKPGTARHLPCRRRRVGRSRRSPNPAPMSWPPRTGVRGLRHHLGGLVACGRPTAKEGNPLHTAAPARRAIVAATVLAASKVRWLRATWTGDGLSHFSSRSEPRTLPWSPRHPSRATSVRGPPNQHHGVVPAPGTQRHGDDPERSAAWALREDAAWSSGSARRLPRAPTAARGLLATDAAPPTAPTTAGGDAQPGSMSAPTISQASMTTPALARCRPCEWGHLATTQQAEVQDRGRDSVVARFGGHMTALCAAPAAGRAPFRGHSSEDQPWRTSSA